MKKLCLVLALLFCAGALILPIFAQEPYSSLLVDEADLLSAEEEYTLDALLTEISDRHEVDVVIVTMEGVTAASCQATADDYYDYHNYRSDGILLLCCVEGDILQLSTTGSAIDYFEGSREAELSKAVRSGWNSGDYYKGFTAYAQACDQILEAETSFPLILIPLALVLGVVLSFLIPMSVLKGQLKSVRAKAAASDYVRPDSMHLTVDRDIFLYRNVTRSAKPKESSSGSRTGSSGTRHGGGRL